MALRPAGVENNHAYYCDRAISEDRCQQNWPGSDHDHGSSQGLQTDFQSTYEVIDIVNLTYQQSNSDSPAFFEDDDVSEEKKTHRNLNL